MNYRSVFVPFILAGAFSASIQAAPFKASGVIHFTGAVVAPTSVPDATRMPLHADPARAITIESLAQARTRVTSALLDYYAQYAKPRSQLISTVYQ